MSPWSSKTPQRSPTPTIPPASSMMKGDRKFRVQEKDVIRQRSHFTTTTDKKMESKLKSPSAARSVNVDEAVAFLGWGTARETRSCKLQLHGNMKTTTDWQCIHLWGGRLLRKRRGWGKWQIRNRVRKVCFLELGYVFNSPNMHHFAGVTDRMISKCSETQAAVLYIYLFKFPHESLISHHPSVSEICFSLHDNDLLTSHSGISVQLLC